MTADEDNPEPKKLVRKHDIPVPGPHARPELTDNDKTPGTGMLPDAENANEAPSG
jgi:hypothetical protein